MSVRLRVASGRLDPVGVVDIGSNSIRLVVFDGAHRAPSAIFNEKVLCGLGRGLARTGKLNPEGVESALENLQRFARLAEAMGVADVSFVATAAVRDADNGKEFVRAVEARIGRRVRILSGADEARISAMGVVAGIPDAQGLAGDLGGGSLELVRIAGARIGAHATLPLGPLRLKELESRTRAREEIDRHLAKLDWLEGANGQRFYAVGGAWRSLARMHMAHAGYPLHVIHHYSLARARAEEFCDLVSRLSAESLDKVTDVSRKRLQSLPLAALVLERVLKRARPEQLVFAATGLREGCIYEGLTAAERRKDPLISACERLARSDARYPVDAQRLMAWLTPLFRGSSARSARLRLATCLVSDVGWGEHPDYRAEIAYLRTLRMPFLGLDHPARAFIALAVFTRYEGIADADVTRPSWQLLDEAGLHEAHTLGLALRLAYTLSAGTSAILRQFILRLEAGTLTLVGTARARPLVAEAVERRLEALARAIARRPRIRIGRS